MARAILIDPFDQTVTEILLPEEPGMRGHPTIPYPSMKEVLQIPTGYITVCAVGEDRNGRSLDLICDDEGRLQPQWEKAKDGTYKCIQRCFMMAGTMLIAGRALLVGHDIFGNTTGTGLLLEDAVVPIEWLPEDVDYTPPDPVIIPFATMDALTEHMAKMGGDK